MMFSKRRALAAEMVMLTVIIGSVVLASGVVLYATSLFQVGAQQEAISVTGIKIWVHGNDANGLAWGAFTVRNSGDKVLSVHGIVVRGTDVPFAQWYADTTLTSAPHSMRAFTSLIFPSSAALIKAVIPFRPVFSLRIAPFSNNNFIIDNYIV